MSENQPVISVETEPLIPVEAELEFFSEGKRVKKTFKLLYRAITKRIARKIVSAIKANDETEEPRDQEAVELAVIVSKVEGVEVETNVDFFESLLGKSCQNIFAAINKDIEGPEKQPSDSAPNS